MNSSPLQLNSIQLNSSSVLCAICRIQPPKYTCPKCSLHTCSLVCCLHHKSQFDCNGKRPLESSQFAPLCRMTDATIISDYQFLQQGEQLTQSGVRLLRDLGCPVSNPKSWKVTQGKKRQHGGSDAHDLSSCPKRQHQEKEESQPLLLLNSTVAPNPLPEGENVSHHVSLCTDEINIEEYLEDDSAVDRYPVVASSITLEVPESTKYPTALSSSYTLNSMVDIFANTDRDLPPSQCQRQKNHRNTKKDNHIRNSIKAHESSIPNQNSHTKDISSISSWLLRYPKHLQTLVEQAKQFCNITLLLMPQGMQRRIMNKDTRYNVKRNGMDWGRVEFVFHCFSSTDMSLTTSHSDTQKTDKHDNHSTAIVTLENVVDSTSILSNLLLLINRYLSHSGSATIDAKTKAIIKGFTSSRDVSTTTRENETEKEYNYYLKGTTRVLMKKIPCKASEPKYIEFWNTKETTLCESLRGTTIIEYPTFDIVSVEDLCRFPRIIEDCKSHEQ